MKSTFVSRLTLLGTTAIALGMGVGHAYAAAPDEKIPTLVVHFQDLNLSQPQDAQRLYRRIQTAARLVCDNPLLPSLTAAQVEHTCIVRAVSEAVGQIGSVQVTQIHEAATQRLANRG
jgi:UrcA family protein